MLAAVHVISVQRFVLRAGSGIVLLVWEHEADPEVLLLGEVVPVVRVLRAINQDLRPVGATQEKQASKHSSWITADEFCPFSRGTVRH